MNKIQILRKHEDLLCIKLISVNRKPFTLSLNLGTILKGEMKKIKKVEHIINDTYNKIIRKYRNQRG